MAISAKIVKQLRESTSCPIIDCKKALEEANGDLEKAKKILQKKGMEIAAKKSERKTTQGRIEAYIHHGSKLGVLLEVDCESDFVARNEEFCQFTKDLSMQIAATNPQFLRKEEVPIDLLNKQEDKDLFIRTNCLLEQPFIKDQNTFIKDYLNSLIAKLRENIVIRRFTRYKVGE